MYAMFFGSDAPKNKNKNQLMHQVLESVVTRLLPCPCDQCKDGNYTISRFTLRKRCMILAFVFLALFKQLLGKKSKDHTDKNLFQSAVQINELTFSCINYHIQL